MAETFYGRMGHPFDLSDPQWRKRIEGHIRLLETRTVAQIEALHYLETRAGRWICLDIDTSGASEEALDDAVREKLRALPDDAAPKVARLPLWVRMTEAKFERCKTLDRIPAMRVRLLVVICRES